MPSVKSTLKIAIKKKLNSVISHFDEPSLDFQNFFALRSRPKVCQPYLGSPHSFLVEI